MKYMLLVYSPESAWSQEEWVACARESTEVCHEIESKGQYLAASPLQPVATAVTVRVREGSPLMTTGPFAETVEQLGGFFLVDVPDLDDAISIAERLPSAKKGTVEIRPVHPLPGLPTDDFQLPLKESTPPGQVRYMLLCYDVPDRWTELGAAALESARAQAVEGCRQLAGRRQYVSASPLGPISLATSVRVRHGKRQVTDGPFAETREVLGGYYIVLARDLNEAARIAEDQPCARHGMMEVRRLVDLPGLPGT